MEENELNMDLFENESLELSGLDYESPDEAVEDTEEPTEENKDINKPGEEEKDPSEEVAGEENLEEEDNSDNTDDSSDTNDGELYSSFASVLKEQGLLPSLNLEKDKISSLEDLAESIRGEIKAQSDQYLVEKIGEQGLKALEKGVSLGEYQQYQKAINTLDSIKEEDLSDLELAKNIILQDYVAQGIPQERAMRILKKSIELGDDIVLEDAKESLKSLRATQDIKLAEIEKEREAALKAQKKEQEKLDNDLKNSIYNSKEIIEGFKPSKTVKDKVYRSITEIVGQSPDGVPENKLMKQRREDPIGFDTKLYYLYELTEGFSDFSKLIQSSESKAIKNLNKALRHTKFEGSTKPVYMEDPESYSGLSDNSELVL